jgi:signal transduction histidine kinase
LITYYSSGSGAVQAGVYDGLGACSALAVLAGVWVYRPRRALPWLVLAGGIFLFVAGDVVWDVYALAFGGVPFPSAADALYLSAYPAWAVAGFLLLGPLGRTHGRLAWLDAAIVAVGLIVPTWVFLIKPFSGGGGSALEQAVSVAYPTADVVLIALAARLLVTPGRKRPAFVCFTMSVLVLLVADASFYGAGEGTRFFAWLAALYMLVYAGWGLTALHPSMRELGSAARTTVVRLTPLAITVMVLASLAAPATIAWQLDAGRGVDLFEIGLATLLVLLALARMFLIAREADRLRSEEALLRAEAETTQRLLAEQNDKLRELDKAKDEFISLISHDLRTPLTSILGYTEMLLEEEATPANELRRNLRVIERNGQRLLRMVEDLLFLARLQAGQLILDPGDVDLTEIARNCIEALQPRAAKLGVTLTFHAPQSLPMTGDAHRLGQLLDNLTSNALKFTPAGGRVTVALEHTDTDASLTVTDTGIGIPQDEVEKLFDRFFRASTATKRELPGTGLGLTITKAIVDAHHGTIRIKSTEGTGTSFQVQLPLHPPEPDTAAETAMLERTTSG